MQPDSSNVRTEISHRARVRYFAEDSNRMTRFVPIRHIQCCSRQLSRGHSNSTHFNSRHYIQTRRFGLFHLRKACSIRSRPYFFRRSELCWPELRLLYFIVFEHGLFPFYIHCQPAIQFAATGRRFVPGCKGRYRSSGSSRSGGACSSRLLRISDWEETSIYAA